MEASYLTSSRRGHSPPCQSSRNEILRVCWWQLKKVVGEKVSLSHFLGAIIPRNYVDVWECFPSILLLQLSFTVGANRTKKKVSRSRAKKFFFSFALPRLKTKVFKDYSLRKDLEELPDTRFIFSKMWNSSCEAHKMFCWRETFYFMCCSSITCKLRRAEDMLPPQPARAEDKRHRFPSTSTKHLNFSWRANKK